MTKTLNSQVVFFLLLLISFTVKYNAQTNPSDTIKTFKPDTLNTVENEELEGKVSYLGEDSMVFIMSDSKLYLFGKGHVTYGDIDLKSEFIEVDYKKNIVTAFGKRDSLGKAVGHPVFKEGDEEMTAEKIMYNLKTKKGKIFNALTHQGELLVLGSEIKKDSTDVIYMKDMRCIPCKDEDARTKFRATKAKIIPNDKIVTGPLYLEIGGVPTPLALPFGFFPNTKKQKSGILLPMPGQSASQGFFLQEGGYYWGINPQTDMIIKGDIYSNGSWAARTTNNYYVLYKAAGSVNLGYKSFNFGDKDVPTSYSKDKSYSVAWVHNQDNKSNPSVRFGANVNFVNNQRINRINALNSGEFLNNTFQSNINFTKSFKLTSLSINAMHSQNSQTKYAEITLPGLTFNVNRFFPFKRENAVRQNVFDKIGVNYLLEARNTLSGADTTLFQGDLNKKLRYGIKHSLPISTNFNLFKYITITPALNFNAVMYTQSTSKRFENDFIAPKVISDTTTGFVAGYDASYSTSMNTKIYFDYLYKKGRLSQVRHLMIPTLAHTYRPDFGKEQYGFWKKVQTDTIGNFTRYSIFEKSLFGGPGIGEQNALSINLYNTLDAKTKKMSDSGYVYNKISLLQEASIGASYNMAADSFHMSDIRTSARTKLFKQFDVQASAFFDPYAYDFTTNRRINEFAYNTGGPLGRFKNANFIVSTSLSSNLLEAAKAKRNPSITNGVEQGAANNLVKDEKLPWNLFINYGLELRNIEDRVIYPTHSLMFSGDLMPTKFWKIGLTSGFDFTSQKISYTTVNIYRDLKCWEARIDWVPFGSNKSYRIVINLKTAMLRDFKIPKQSRPYDNF
ncbi:MAG: LPS-assembly protein LptD [Sphingobacteriaceae bacterium]|nr:LPS-assembly protein LptD [Sphingobacteriaceae bacterium]